MSPPFVVLFETFSWKSPDGKTSGTFDVTRMLRDIEMRQLSFDNIMTQLDKNFAETWVAKRDINMEYCIQMSLKRRNTPVLGVWMPDGSVLLIDGSHRYMSRFLFDEPTVEYNIVRYPLWRPYAKIRGKL
jgi:hypothetical protein